MPQKKFTEESIYSWYNFNIDRGNRTLYFGPWNDSDTGLGTAGREPWEVNDFSAQNIIKGLHVLEAESKEEEEEDDEAWWECYEHRGRNWD